VVSRGDCQNEEVEWRRTYKSNREETTPPPTYQRSRSTAPREILGSRRNSKAEQMSS
jgi:hypothetical protein